MKAPPRITSLIPTSPTASSTITSFILWVRKQGPKGHSCGARPAPEQPSQSSHGAGLPAGHAPRHHTARSREAILAPAAGSFLSVPLAAIRLCVYLPADDWLMICPTQTRTHSGTEEGKSGPSPVFVNKVLLEHSHAHSFAYCLWLLWPFTSRDESATPAGGSQSPGGSLSGPTERAWGPPLKRQLRESSSACCALCFTPSL